MTDIVDHVFGLAHRMPTWAKAIVLGVGIMILGVLFGKADAAFGAIISVIGLLTSLVGLMMGASKLIPRPTASR